MPDGFRRYIDGKSEKNKIRQDILSSDCLYYGNDKREEIDNKILLDNELSSMDEFDRSLIEFRYYQGYTQSETADALGVSQVKVSRQEKLILSRMKSNICA